MLHSMWYYGPRHALLRYTDKEIGKIFQLFAPRYIKGLKHASFLQEIIPKDIACNTKTLSE